MRNRSARRSELWPDPGDGFRTDIEGLRGVSVLLVVLFHLEINVFSGGFVGVDVFFVISGYLLTSLFFKEIERKNFVNVFAFFSRRVRRLLPASILTVFGTVLIGWLVLSPFALEELIKDAFTASTYSMNFRLVHQATDYLGSQSSPSVFQHYWSLAVEEQFYLIWPFIFAAFAKLKTSREQIGIFMVILIAASFGFSVIQTEQNEIWAFFMLPTRAWEMALGALIACYKDQILLLNEKLIEILGFIGLASILIPCVLYDDFTLYPSWRAAFPVIGTALIISCAGSTISKILSFKALTTIGKYSYGWYLWHWPFICLAKRYYFQQNDLFVSSIASIIAFIVAVISYKVIEKPIRELKVFSRQPKKGAVLGVLLTGLSVLGLLIAFYTRPTSTIPLSSSQNETPISEVSSNDSSEGTSEPSITSEDLTNSAPVPETMDGHLQDHQEMENPTNPTPAPDIMNVYLPEHQERLAEGAQLQVLPDYVGLGGPNPKIYGDGQGCHVGVVGRTSPLCEYGDTSASRTMVLFGDSHAASWFPLFDQYSKEKGWRLLSRTKSSCFVEDLKFPLYGTDLEYTKCSDWKNWVVNELQENPVDLVIVVTKRKDVEIIRDQFSVEEWQSGLVSTLNSFRSVSSEVVLIGATPFLNNHARECVTSYPNNLDFCHGKFEDVVPSDYQTLEIQSADDAQVKYLPTIDLVCTDTICPVVVGNNVVYRDRQHLTKDFVLELKNLISIRLLNAGINLD
tara:strand:+ start:200 stop:2419 length:2220 start_codon:yes stop_codon:yes gene_type:complete